MIEDLTVWLGGFFVSLLTFAAGVLVVKIMWTIAVFIWRIW